LVASLAVGAILLPSVVVVLSKGSDFVILYCVDVGQECER
jgi:uncharacterized membrane protein YqaE (UPF0057 family)